MAIDFPAAPTGGQEYTDNNGVAWTFNGELWHKTLYALQGPKGDTGDTGAVVESGSNVSGSWIKYFDGAMVQWGKASSYGVKNFPQAFININATVNATVENENTTWIYVAQIHTITTNTFDSEILGTNGGAPSLSSVPFRWTAHGWWK